MQSFFEHLKSLGKLLDRAIIVKWRMDFYDVGSLACRGKFKNKACKFAGPLRRLPKLRDAIFVRFSQRGIVCKKRLIELALSVAILGVQGIGAGRGNRALIKVAGDLLDGGAIAIGVGNIVVFNQEKLSSHSKYLASFISRMEL
jgi:hypothetical protein